MDTKKSAKLESGVADAEYSFAINLMQYLVVPTFVLDAEGRVLIWNKACERLTGVPASDVLGTREHWSGFYDSPRPCLADLIVHQRTEEINELYAAYGDASTQTFGVRAENWCVMPRLGTELYLAIDAGPIYDEDGKLLAVVETLRDMSTQKKAQTQLEYLATFDSLTAIANRRSFDEKLSIEWRRESRDELPLALIMLDVDHFKLYNDTYGHQMGDECLRKIGGILAQSVRRPSDLVARYGGEEFALILPSIDLAGAETVAARIRDGIAKLAIAHSSGEGGQVTVSIGIATVFPKNGRNQESLLLSADNALYRAKRSGRNRIVSQRVEEESPIAS